MFCTFSLKRDIKSSLNLSSSPTSTTSSTSLSFDSNDFICPVYLFVIISLSSFVILPSVSAS